VDIAKRQGLLSDADVEAIEDGITGYTHGGGSVDAKKAAVLRRYQVLFQLRTLTKSDRLYRALEKVAPHLPLKQKLYYLLFAISGLRHNPEYYYSKLRFAATSAVALVATMLRGRERDTTFTSLAEGALEPGT
jgi:hypothetical protein